MYYSLRYYNEEAQLVGLFFSKDVVELVVIEILAKYTYSFWIFFSKTEIVNLRIPASDAFTFTKKNLKETIHFSGCWLFLKKWNHESVVIWE